MTIGGMNKARHTKSNTFANYNSQRLNQSFVNELSKPTNRQKDSAAKMRDNLTKDKKGQLVIVDYPTS